MFLSPECLVGVAGAQPLGWKEDPSTIPIDANTHNNGVSFTHIPSTPVPTWESMQDSLKWYPGTTPCSIAWTKDYGTWNWSSYNKFEFWLWVDESCPDMHANPVVMKVVLETDSPGDGYEATVTVDHAGWHRHVIIYFGHTLGNSENFRRIPWTMPAGYHVIKKVRFEIPGTYDTDKVRFRISKIKVSSDRWLWDVDEYGINLNWLPDAIREDLQDDIYANEWGKVGQRFQHYIMGTWWRLENPIWGKTLNPGYEEDFITYYQNYLYYDAGVANAGTQSFRDINGVCHGNVSWTKIWHTSPPAGATTADMYELNQRLNRHESLIGKTAGHYYATGNYLALQRAREFIASFIADADWNVPLSCGDDIRPVSENWYLWTEPLCSVYVGMAHGLRIQTWLALLQYESDHYFDFGFTPIVTRELFLAMVKSMFNQAAWVQRVSDKGDLKDWNNHQALSAQALHTVHSRLPWFYDKETLVNAAYHITSGKTYNTEQYGLVHYRNDAPDGANIEVNSHYHLFYVMPFNTMYNNPVQDVNHAPRFVKQRNAAREYLKWTSKPYRDGLDRVVYFPTNNDGNYLETLTHGTYDPFLEIQDHDDIPVLSRAFEFPLSGHTVIRSDDTPEALYLFMESGPFGTGVHQHRDNLTVEISWGGLDWIVDSGGFSSGGSCGQWCDENYHNVPLVKLLEIGRWPVQTRDKNSEAIQFTCDCNSFFNGTRRTSSSGCTRLSNSQVVKRTSTMFHAFSPPRLEIEDKFHVSCDGTSLSRRDDPPPGDPVFFQYRVRFQTPPGVIVLVDDELVDLSTYRLDLLIPGNGAIMELIVGPACEIEYDHPDIELATVALTSGLIYMNGVASGGKTEITYTLTTNDWADGPCTDMRIVSRFNPIQMINGRNRYEAVATAVAAIVGDPLTSPALSMELVGVFSRFPAGGAWDEPIPTAPRLLASMVNVLAVNGVGGELGGVLLDSISDLLTHQFISVIGVDGPLAGAAFLTTFTSELSASVIVARAADHFANELKNIADTFRRMRFDELAGGLDTLRGSVRGQIALPSVERVTLRMVSYLWQRVELHLSLFDLLVREVSHGRLELEESVGTNGPDTIPGGLAALLDDLERYAGERNHALCEDTVLRLSDAIYGGGLSPACRDALIPMFRSLVLVLEQLATVESSAMGRGDSGEREVR